MQTATTIDYESLILKGIIEAGGQTEDITLLTEDDLVALGRMAAERVIKKRKKFSSWEVEPICDVNDAYARGQYTDKYDWITRKTVPLPKATGKKRVFIVPFNRTIGETEFVKLLAEHDLKPCVNGASYLAGLMAKVPESEMQGELANKHIIAAEPDNPSAVFQNRYGSRCFLCVRRSDGGARRRLSLANVEYGDWDGHCAFLAEEA